MEHAASNPEKVSTFQIRLYESTGPNRFGTRTGPGVTSPRFGEGKTHRMSSNVFCDWAGAPGHRHMLIPNRRGRLRCHFVFRVEFVRSIEFPTGGDSVHNKGQAANAAARTQEGQGRGKLGIPKLPYTRIA